MKEINLIENNICLNIYLIGSKQIINRKMSELLTVK